MKKILSILLIATSLSSCGDFLEIPSETSLSSDIYYQSQSDFEQAINGCYSLLRGLYSGQDGAWAMGELRSDNTTYAFNPNDRGTISAEFVKDFIDDANNSVFLRALAYLDLVQYFGSVPMHLKPVRATSGAANMILANVYINQKKWAEAETALRQITGYELLEDYSSVFEPTNKNNRESIFEVQYKQGNEGFASYFFYTFLAQPITILSSS